MSQHERKANTRTLKRNTWRTRAPLHLAHGCTATSGAWLHRYTEAQYLAHGCTAKCCNDVHVYKLPLLTPPNYQAPLASRLHETMSKSDIHHAAEHAAPFLN